MRRSRFQQQPVQVGALGMVDRNRVVHRRPEGAQHTKRAPGVAGRTEDDLAKELIRELSRYIDDKIKEVCGKYPNITPLKALILTTFTIAEELHDLKSEQEAITKDIEQKTQLLAGILKGS